MDVVKKLKITYETGLFDQKFARLNMPVKTLFEAVGATDWDFFEKLHERGVEIDCPVMASEQDLKDYAELQSLIPGEFEHEPENISEAEKAETERLRGLDHVLSNLVYYDIEFTDSITGKCGLKDTNGIMVVPPLFERGFGVRCVWDYLNLAVVMIDSKLYFTPRDNSGKVMDIGPFDKVNMSGDFAWVYRNGKRGILNSTTLEDIVPCEMDWIIINQFGLDKLLGKQEKLGLYDGYLEKYVEPVYSAFDYTTLRFCKDGEWGWVLRESGEFTTVPPKNRYEIMMPGLDAKSFLNNDDKPKKRKEKEYYTAAEVFGRIEKSEKKFKRELERPLADYLKLRPLRFPKDTYVSQTIYDALLVLCEKEKDGKLTVCSTDNKKAPAIHVSLHLKDGKKTITVEWSPRNNALAWHDVLFLMTGCFHQFIVAHKDTFGFKFTRDFTTRQLPTISKFIIHYYQAVWGVAELKIKN